MSRMPFTVPVCVIEGMKLLFPTLDFSRIHFFIEDTDREPVTAAYFGRTEITLSKDFHFWEPCDVVYLQVLSHELVHALQAQGFWDRIEQRAARWTCGFFHGGPGKTAADSGHCIEKEAYDYDRQLRELLTPLGVPKPCFCVGNPAVTGGEVVHKLVSHLLPVRNVAFKSFVQAHPELVKATAGCTPWDCIGSGIIERIVGFFFALGAYLVAIGSAFVSGPISAVTSILGVAVGIGVGAAAFGVLGAIGGAIFGAFIGAFLGTIIEWIVSLFGGGAGSLNVMFSNDQGHSWPYKHSFHRSSEPMSLSFGQLSLPATTAPPESSTYFVDRLSVAWTGLDNHLNLMTLWQNGARRVEFEDSEDCGPALCSAGVRVHIVWQGTDNVLNVIVTNDGAILTAKTTLYGTESPSDASPAICHTGSRHVLTYIGTDQHINLLSSDNGINDWGHQLVLGDTACEDTTVAITAFDNHAVMIAWTGEDQHVNLMELQVAPDGTLTPGFRRRLDERSSDEAGPALASVNAYLYLAWTGTDGQVNFMASESRGRSFFAHRVFEHSRQDCGPALSASHDGTICIGWVGTDA